MTAIEVQRLSRTPATSVCGLATVGRPEHLQAERHRTIAIVPPAVIARNETIKGVA